MLAMFVGALALMGQDPKGLQTVVDQSVAATIKAFPKVKSEEIGVCVMSLTKNVQAGHNEDKAFYPASVVKLFWLAFLHETVTNRKLGMSSELERAAADMIKDSSNDATALVVDMVTGTTGGPELEPDAFKAWSDMRNVANAWFLSQGYGGINVCQKTWGDGPYGRERQFYGPKYENRNFLTPVATARLMGRIATFQVVSRSASEAMLKLLKRQNPQDGKSDDAQAMNYIGKVIPKGSELYSKAGWTSTARHDVAYVKLPSRQEFVLAIYTMNHANEPKIMESIARPIVEYLAALREW